MNGHYLSSTGLKSIRLGLTMHGSSINDTQLVDKDSLNVNNALNTRLIRLNVILYHYYSLNIYECLICQIYQ